MSDSADKDFIIIAETDRGSVREKNEDYYGIFQPETDELLDQLGILVVVSDGMGGHFSGAEASRAAVDAISEFFFDEAEGGAVERLEAAFREANAYIFEEVGKGVKGMAGTTCTAALLFPEFVHVVHAGDSRAYLFRKDEIEQLTIDHSVVGEMMRKGILTKEEARSHPRRNVITRAMGLRKKVQVDIIESVPLWPGDTVLLCSDGLTAMVSEEEIAAIVRSLPPEKAAKKLVERAKEEGGIDNITIVVAKKRER
jgi:serine/threonine protein phosphatase PrpC